jgi:hypothetical protein
MFWNKIYISKVLFCLFTRKLHFLSAAFLEEFESSYKVSTYTKCWITITLYKPLNTFLHNLFHFAIHCPVIWAVDTANYAT